MKTLRPHPETAHWYTREGVPCHYLPNKSRGGERPTTLRDAKKLDLVPSVTTIMRGGLPKPYGLELWDKRQLLEHALTTERREGETDAEYVQRIQDDYEAAKAAPADLGTRVHACIADTLRGEYTPGVYTDQELLIADRAITWLEVNFPHAIVQHVEHTVVHREYAYAGTIDVVLRDGRIPILIDWKTQEPKGGEVKVRDDWVRQLAAYSAAYDSVYNTQCVNVILPTDGSETSTRDWSLREVVNGWDVFLAARRVYYALNWPERLP